MAEKSGGIGWPNRVVAHEQARDYRQDEVWICSPPAWDGEDGAWSVKRGHRIPGGKWQRAGEVPGGEFPMQAIELAYREGWYETADIVDHIKKLLDLIAASPKP